MSNHLSRRSLLAAGALSAAALPVVNISGATAVPAVTTSGTAAAPDDPPYAVLVFSKTAGFRHDSIEEGITALQELGAENNFTVTATEDGAAFTSENLAQHRVVVFLSTTGDVLDDAQQTAFEEYIAGGGGYVGIHAASDTEYDWPWYGELVGAYFASHPEIQAATVTVEDQAHDSTAHLPAAWQRTDEWYNYQSNPRENVRVLASLDESSYSGGTMNGDHPIAWCHEYAGGRSFYTGGGHTIESYAEPEFLRHLLGGIRWAAGIVDGDPSPEDGYTSLFDGTGTDGWTQAGPGSFTLADGILTSQGGLGMLWYEAREFTSYSLKLGWQVEGDDNSGVIVGFPATSDPQAALDSGYEVQIDATDADDRTTGSVYGIQAPDLAARDAALNPPGSWNSYEIRVEGERLRVYLNATLINDFTNTDPARSLTDGHIGIQNHGPDDTVSFRNIRIKELGNGGAPGSRTAT
jgi:type 1 glutamine amidotransferase